MAINLMNVKPNLPKANIEDYFWLIMGVPKGGKTSLLYKIADKKFDGDVSKLLLLAFERGYNALYGIHAVDIEKFEDFQEVITQLIEEKDKLPYRLIGLDTLDIMWSLAEEYVVRKQSVADKKRYKTISDIPWGAGWGLVADAVQKEIGRLSKAGFGLFAITHVKEKKFETRSGLSFDKYTATLSNKARELFVGMADFVLFLDVTKEKEGDSIVDKRYIYFRTDGTVEAGSRFASVPEKIEYDVDLFLETFEKAVLAEYNGDKNALAEAKKEQEKEKEEQVKEFVEEQKSATTVEELQVQMDELVKAMDSEKQSEFKKVIKEKFGIVNYKKYDLGQLQEALEMAKNL